MRRGAQREGHEPLQHHRATVACPIVHPRSGVQLAVCVAWIASAPLHTSKRRSAAPWRATTRTRRRCRHDLSKQRVTAGHARSCEREGVQCTTHSADVRTRHSCDATAGGAEVSDRDDNKERPQQRRRESSSRRDSALPTTMREATSKVRTHAFDVAKSARPSEVKTCARAAT